VLSRWAFRGEALAPPREATRQPIVAPTWLRARLTILGDEDVVSEALDIGRNKAQPQPALSRLCWRRKEESFARGGSSDCTAHGLARGMLKPPGLVIEMAQRMAIETVALHAANCSAA
jgi:hypothetical protein